MTVRSISPMLVTDDIPKTLAFYREVLGFTVSMQSEQYAIVELEGKPIHFTLAENAEAMSHARGHASIYIEVTDIQSLWNKVQPHKTNHKIRDLFDQPYGMKEFHIIDPNDCLVFVGQRL